MMPRHSLSAIAQAFATVECPDVLTTFPPPRRRRRFLPRPVVFALGMAAGVVLVVLVLVVLR